MTSLFNKKSNSKGFTLIELLIVIIIIGILAAIAFVAYSGTQNKAHQAAAQSTLSEVGNKLGEYNSDNGNYPTTQASFNTWLASATGGNNTTLAATFVTPDYTYTPSPASCDNSATPCTGYTIDANKAQWNGSADITVTN
ncbi:MAG TPA: prepilin-type N-terminal cleavage/methylation domain-containing protein [Candidatus Saccharimonadales bacterium]